MERPPNELKHEPRRFIADGYAVVRHVRQALARLLAAPSQLAGAIGRCLPTREEVMRSLRDLDVSSGYH